MVKLEKGSKIIDELLLIDEIVYGVEPKYYYDDGVRRIYKFIDSDNNIYVWKTSKVIGCDFINDKGEEGFLFADIGDRIFLKGVVKDISNYKGEDQIVISRCKIQSVEGQVKTEEEIKEIKRQLQLAKFDGVKEIKTISYKEYKGEYNKYEPVVDSFVRTDKGCFIDIIIPQEEMSGLYYYSE